MNNRLWQQNGFSIIVNLEPPKGTDMSGFEKQADRLKERVDGVLVHDCSDAIMRMTPMAACLKLSGMGISSALGMNGRDRNRLALQGDLLGAWSMGIGTLLLEDGKDPSYGDHPLTKPITDLCGPELVSAVYSLNQGKDQAGGDLTGATNFDIGAYCEWLDTDQQVDLEFRKMGLMHKAGASTFVVSPQFDINRTRSLIDRGKDFGARFFVSVLLLKSVGMARYLNEVPGISTVPDDVIQQMTSAPVKARAGIDIACDFIENLRDIADGVVLMPLGWEHKVPEILDRIGR